MNDGQNIVFASSHIFLPVCSKHYQLHKVGLQSIDESVFGHIQDWTLTRPEAGTASLSLPGIPDSAGKRSSSPGKEIVLD